MPTTNQVKDILVIIAGILGLVGVAATVYGVWCRAMVTAERDTDNDGSISEAEFEAYMDSEAAIPILAPLAKGMMKIISMVWKYPTPTGGDN